MESRLTQRSLFWGLVFLIVVIGYWLLPIPGQVLLVGDDWLEINAWPQVRMTSEELRPGQEASLLIYDTVPWPHVKLLADCARQPPCRSCVTKVVKNANILGWP